MTKAVFFDRDGVLNYDYGYVYKYNNFIWRTNVLRALKLLNKKNYYIFIITNQAGIGRGHYKDKDFINLHKRLKMDLNLKKIYIDEVKYCPHHPIFARGIYKKKCKCRKPNNLLIRNILKKWPINLSKSFMLGDKVSDKNCAKKSNLKFYWAEKDIYHQLKKIINKKNIN